LLTKEDPLLSLLQVFKRSTQRFLTLFKKKRKRSQLNPNHLVRMLKQNLQKRKIQRKVKSTVQKVKKRTPKKY
jgi:transcriptional regulator NrdR family protein